MLRRCAGFFAVFLLVLLVVLARSGKEGAPKSTGQS